MSKRTVGALLTALLIAFAALACAAPAANGAELSCQMGYGGTVTYLRQIPVTIEVTNNGADASGVVQLEVKRSTNSYDIYETPLSVASGATARVTMPVKLTFKQSDYILRWVVDGVAVAEQKVKPNTTVDPSTLLVGVLSDNQKSLSQFDITQNKDPLMRMEYWRTIALSADELPEAFSGMSCFDMLMIDGFDLGTLSAAQQSALERWITEGGVVIVGGGAQAATAFPYFERYTGISAGALADGGDISKMLIAALKSGEAAADEPVRICELRGASRKAVGGDVRLVDITEVGEGKILTCAFSLSDEPFAAWQGSFALWQRLMLEYENMTYSRIVSSHDMNSRYRSYYYVDNGILTSMDIPNTAGSVLPVILLGVFVLLAGFGGYFILKRFDKREWMWALVPALALCCSLGMWALSGSLGITKPVAAYYTIIRVDADGTTESFTGVLAAKADAERMNVSVSGGTINPKPGRDYFEAYQSEETGEAMQLNNTYRFGADAGVELPRSRVWQDVDFAVEDTPVRSVNVAASCVLDGDGLLFELRNESDLPLENGIIITDYGYVTVDALAPGQTITARLDPSEDPAAVFSSEDVINGVLLSNAQKSSYSTYNFISAYSNLGKKDPSISPSLNSLRYSMLQGLLSGPGWDAASDNMHYLAFSRDLLSLDLKVDGERVQRISGYGVVDIRIKYNPISADGTVRFLKGGFPLYTASVDKQDKPSPVSAVVGQYNYYRLDDKPTFAFDMKALPEGFELTEYRLAASYTYYSYKISLYNAAKGAWDEVITSVYDPSKGASTESVTLKSPLGYICDDGMLYARFEKLAMTDDYSEINAPVLTMDGRVR